MLMLLKEDGKVQCKQIVMNVHEHNHIVNN